MPRPICHRIVRCLLLLVLLCPAAVLRAQPVTAPTAAASDSTGGRADAIRAFLDCSGDTALGCSPDFFVLELPYVNWTRDRLFADVQFLVTTIQTGSGAFQYTVTAIGRGRFGGRADTTVVNTLPNESEDGIRRRLSGTFALLLVPYVRTTSAAAQLRVVYDSPVGAAQASPQSVRDKWNFFVLRLEMNGFMQTEARQTFANGNAEIRVSRVTEKHAIRFGWNQNARYNKFEINDSTTVANTIREGILFARGVTAITPHLSVGLLTNAGFNDFRNTELFWRAAPVIEYNLFPWKQATSRQLAVSYGVGPRHFRWNEPTIFGRSSEWRMQQELVLGSDVRQSWGNVNASVRYASFVPDTKRWNLSLFANTSLNLVRGLSFNLGGSASLIRDQIFLAAGGQSPEQILTQQRALASNYSAFVFTGLAYSFGSIFNSVVNPRLDFFNLGGNN